MVSVCERVGHEEGTSDTCLMRQFPNFLAGKELQRAATFSSYHLFTLHCYKSEIVPIRLRIKAPVNTQRARDAAHRAESFCPRAPKNVIEGQGCSHAEASRIPEEFTVNFDE